MLASRVASVGHLRPELQPARGKLRVVGMVLFCAWLHQFLRLATSVFAPGYILARSQSSVFRDSSFLNFILNEMKYEFVAK